jgi:predicted  nucleic acid-binding Zn-ribbon protein
LIRFDTTAEIFDKSVVALLIEMEDIAAEIAAVKAKISALETRISKIEAKRDSRSLSDLEQSELTALTNLEAALTNKEVELLKRVPVPGTHSLFQLCS